jgi:hypothetical protein
MLHIGSGCMVPSPLRFPLYAQRIADAVDRHPELWSEYSYRTHGGSPHREAPDIWLRYNDAKNVGVSFNDEHEAVWYPSLKQLPIVRPFVEDFARLQNARKIGAVLITKVPAGKQIYPHADRSWHADNHRKWLILLRGNLEQSFEFEDEQLYCEPGECFEFLNAHTHWVKNPSKEDRMSLIICLRDFQ